MTLPASWKPGRNSADNKERAGDEAKTYADFGIPGPAPAPCPSWCDGTYAASDAMPGYAVIFHGGSAVLAGGKPVSVGMNWTERFDGGAWQPLRDKDVVVFLQAGAEYIAIEATERNMAGLAAVARLISPEAGDRARRLGRLMEETRADRQAAAR